MRVFNRYRLFLGWALLLSLFTHFFVAHHEGVSELILCVQANGQMAVKTSVAHAHGSHHQHKPSQHGEGSHHGENEGEGDDVHLDFVHPETYLSENMNAFQDALGLRLVTILQAVSFGMHFQPKAQFESKQARFSLPPQPHPPPEQRERILSTTYLLI